MSRMGIVGALGFGVIVGTVGTVALMNYHPGPKVDPEETITFSDRTFYDSGATALGDGWVRFSGTYTGPDFHSNNTMSAVCTKDEKRCEIASTSQIGKDQVSEIDLGDWEITEWSHTLIVAQSVDVCGTITMNIDRRSMAVSFVMMPMNLTKPYCSTAATQVQRWTLGRSHFWARNDSAGQRK